MPKETPPKPSRWEGTHTYKKPDTERKKARTVAQLREEAAANSRASREAAINKRRGSIGTPLNATAPRRGSTGGISPTNRTSRPAETEVTTEEVIILSQDLPDQGTSTSTRGENTDEMPGSAKKGRNKSGPDQTDQGREQGEGVDPALIRFLNAMKEDIVQSTRETVGKLESRLDKTEKGLADLEKRVGETDQKIA